MEVRTVSCDVCQVQKKETNHWWHIFAYPKCFVVAPFGNFPFENTFAANDTRKRLDLCGTACLMKKVSELTNDLAVPY